MMLNEMSDASSQSILKKGPILNVVRFSFYFTFSWWQSFGKFLG